MDKYAWVYDAIDDAYKDTQLTELLDYNVVLVLSDYVNLSVRSNSVVVAHALRKCLADRCPNGYEISVSHPEPDSKSISVKCSKVD